MVMAERESGVALLWALLAVTAVAASVLLVASAVASRQPSSRYDHRNVVLTALSDAAMAETLARLSSDPACSGIDERPFGGGTIASTVTTTPYGLREVTAVGEYQEWRSVVRAEVAMDQGPRIVTVEPRRTVRSPASGP